MDDGPCTYSRIGTNRIQGPEPCGKKEAVQETPRGATRIEERLTKLLSKRDAKGGQGLRRKAGKKKGKGRRTGAYNEKVKKQTILRK